MQWNVVQCRAQRRKKEKHTFRLVTFVDVVKSVLLSRSLLHFVACLFWDCLLKVFFSLSLSLLLCYILSLPAKVCRLWNRQVVAEGCLLGRGSWAANRALLCVPCWGGPDQNIQASVLLPLASHTPPVHVYLPVQPKLFVSEALSQYSLLVRHPPRPPSTHSAK